MATIGREILGQRRGKRHSVTVEEWGGEVLLRRLSYAEASTIQALATAAVDPATRQIKDKRLLDDFNFELIRASWIDEQGEPVLTPEDKAALLREDYAVIQRLVKAISEFNELAETAVADAKND